MHLWDGDSRGLSPDLCRLHALEVSILHLVLSSPISSLDPRPLTLGSIRAHPQLRIQRGVLDHLLQLCSFDVPDLTARIESFCLRSVHIYAH